MGSEDHEPEILALRIKALEEWKAEQKEAQTRIIWAIVIGAVMLVWEPIKRLVAGS